MNSATTPQLRYLIHVDEAAAKKLLLGALRKAKMYRQGAAEALGVCHESITRWILRLELTEEVERLDELARKEGWHHGRTGGRIRRKSSKKPRGRASRPRPNA